MGRSLDLTEARIRLAPAGMPRIWPRGRQTGALCTSFPSQPRAWGSCIRRGDLKAPPKGQESGLGRTRLSPLPTPHLEGKAKVTRASDRRWTGQAPQAISAAWGGVGGLLGRSTSQMH